jgi:hypothetical protein
VKNGLGIAIISTSKGVMTDKEAKAQNVGGEVFATFINSSLAIRNLKNWSDTLSLDVDNLSSIR